ncbi:hypothetical protein HDU98_001016 [Podochytrium sp. JEL0797]|nr:hypothetical protein HDU98_001016 [Podochytrium sp. JEL0797]
MKELALLVGNTAHESGAYKFTEKTACKGVTFVTNECPYGLYHGRGLIRLSWKANCKVAAKALGNPQILSSPGIDMNDMSVDWATVQWYCTHGFGAAGLCKVGHFPCKQCDGHQWTY